MTAMPKQHGCHRTKLPWITFGFGCQVQSAAGPQGGRGSCRVPAGWFSVDFGNQCSATRQEPRPPRAALRQTAGNGNTTEQSVSGPTPLNWTGPVGPATERQDSSAAVFHVTCKALPGPSRDERSRKDLCLAASTRAYPSTIRSRWIAPSSTNDILSGRGCKAAPSSSARTTPRLTPDGFSIEMS